MRKRGGKRKKQVVHERYSSFISRGKEGALLEGRYNLKGYASDLKKERGGKGSLPFMPGGRRERGRQGKGPTSVS